MRILLDCEASFIDNDELAWIISLSTIDFFYLDAGAQIA